MRATFSTEGIFDEFIDKFGPVLDALGFKLKNEVLRAGVVAACKPMKDSFRSLLSNYYKPGATKGTIRGTNVPRRHYRDAIEIKVWKMPSGAGFIGYVGAASGEIPHAHWFGPKAPTDRFTKAGQYRGTHLSGKYKGATGGGPADLLPKVIAMSKPAMKLAAEQAMAEKMESIKL